MIIKQKITTNIKAPNKDWEALKKHFPHCFDKDGKFDVVKFQQQLQTQNIELTTEKESYGLDWLGKSYARLLATDPATTLLRPDETHNSKPENSNSENLLIKGDSGEIYKVEKAWFDQFTNASGKKRFNELFETRKGIFSNPKPVELIKHLINLIKVNEGKSVIILDFFAGSATTSDAMMQLNAEDGGNCRFILVQIDEPIKEYKTTYKFCKENNLPPFVSSITIERLKRAGEKIKKEIKDSHHYYITNSDKNDKTYEVLKNLIGLEERHYERQVCNV
ncbi:MAG: DNA methyltransferase [Candidatus Thermochlorobacter sp.]